MDASIWISGGSFGVSLIALWRSGRNRVLDLRTAVRKEVSALRVEIDAMPGRIAGAMQSRRAIGAATGMTGAHMAFQTMCEADLTAVEGLRSQIVNADHIPFWATYSDVEAKMLTASEVRGRLTQMSEKYKAARTEDEKMSDQLRAARIARPIQ